MSTAQQTAFEQLLAGWNHHAFLRESGASIEELVVSRKMLDEYRYLAATAR